MATQSESANLSQPDRRFCVAPMMDCTDRHARYLLRLISRRALLYTEMVPIAALTRGDAERHLAYNMSEHPLAVQLGGSEPDALARGAAMAEAHGYREVNLNVGCPSDRVQSGRFGACLMAEPVLVGECVAAMREATDLPVTVKTRIGIDDQDDYPSFARFIDTVAGHGCATFIIHARKAWLQGLSPRENRDIPPLRYERVHRLKRDFPELEIIINGGINELDTAADQLQHVDGVMLGRAAYHNPYLLAAVDQRIYHDAAPAPDRHQVLERFADYVRTQQAQGVPFWPMARHALGLFQGLRGARAWRRHLTQHGHHPHADADVLLEAAGHVPRQPAEAAA